MSERRISQRQADILTTALSTGEYKGERIPWSVMFVDPTWSAPLSGLIRRGYLSERRHNMFDVTAEGEAALKAWQDDKP